MPRRGTAQSLLCDKVSTTRKTTHTGSCRMVACPESFLRGIHGPCLLMMHGHQHHWLRTALSVRADGWQPAAGGALWSAHHLHRGKLAVCRGLQLCHHGCAPLPHRATALSCLLCLQVCVPAGWGRTLEGAFLHQVVQSQICSDSRPCQKPA